MICVALSLNFYRIFSWRVGPVELITWPLFGHKILKKDLKLLKVLDLKYCALILQLVHSLKWRWGTQKKNRIFCAITEVLVDATSATTSMRHTLSQRTICWCAPIDEVWDGSNWNCMRWLKTIMGPVTSGIIPSLMVWTIGLPPWCYFVDLFGGMKYVTVKRVWLCSTNSWLSERVIRKSVG